MAARLGARTAIDPRWQSAFAEVPREAFLPERVWFNRDHRAVEVKRSDDPDTWWSLVYDEGRSIVIQLDDGRDGGPGDYSSSSTQPYTMARMLALLPDGGRVLEIGSGSGYNAAIMAHRYGAENVVSVEVDPAIAAQAREATADAGFLVKVVCGDAVTGEGIPAGPYDAIIATCGFRALPEYWLELCPSGRIVVPWSTRWADVPCLRLETRDGGAIGRFVRGFVFMDARAHRSPNDRPSETSGGDERFTQLAPTHVSWTSPNAAFGVGLFAPGLDYYRSEVEGHWTCTVWDGNGSWAVVDEEASDEGWRVREHGPRNLWRVVERVHKQWLGWGEPSPDRFGVSITAAGAFVLLDSAKRPVGELPISRERAEHVRAESL